MRFPRFVRRALVFVVMLVALAGCDLSMRQIQAQTANSLAQGANAALPILVDRYRREGLAAIADPKVKTAAEATAALGVVRARWALVWRAWDTLRIAQDSWAVALENDGDTGAALDAIKNAYCGLQAVWPGDIPVLPMVPLKCAPPAPPLALVQPL